MVMKITDSHIQFGDLVWTAFSYLHPQGGGEKKGETINVLFCL